MHGLRPPGGPESRSEGRNAYFADPEENYWEVVYLKSGATGQEAIEPAEE